VKKEGYDESGLCTGVMLYKPGKRPRVYDQKNVEAAKADGWNTLESFLPERPKDGYHEDDVPKIREIQEKLIDGTYRETKVGRPPKDK
jgi:hypothetical protein